LKVNISLEKVNVEIVVINNSQIQQQRSVQIVMIVVQHALMLKLVNHAQIKNTSLLMVNVEIVQMMKFIIPKINAKNVKMVKNQMMHMMHV